MSAVTLLDYGSGNLQSVRRALEHLGADVTSTSDPRDAANAVRLVVPGVGAFGECMARLTSTGLGGAVVEAAGRGVPILGICVGMQVLFSSSVEFGYHAGLGIIPGENRLIVPYTAEGAKLKVPHIGWSELQPCGARPWSGTLLERLALGDMCYFVHSYAPHPTNAANWLAATSYGNDRFCSVVNDGNVWGCQFHPEKSGPVGLSILAQFLKF